MTVDTWYKRRAYLLKTLRDSADAVLDEYREDFERRIDSNDSFIALNEAVEIAVLLLDEIPEEYGGTDSTVR